MRRPPILSESDDLGTLIDLQITRAEFQNLMDSKIPRGLYFLPGNNDSLLVSALGRFDLW